MCVGPLAPKMPSPPPPPPPPEPAPTRDDPAINEEASAIRKRRLAAKGSAQNNLTGGLGDQTQANVGTSILGG